VIRGGYNVYPREIEEVLYEHPDVQEAAVIGIPWRPTTSAWSTWRAPATTRATPPGLGPQHQHQGLRRARCVGASAILILTKRQFQEVSHE
jgi:acyl-CoA synthetase (AMP-forming)/AMP-acid ligase II